MKSKEKILGDGHVSSAKSIQWRVLKKNSSYLLLITKNCVIQRRFDPTSNDYIRSEIRAWLNNEFYNGLTSEQKKLVLNMDITQDGTEQDKVFLLTEQDVQEFFTSNDDRIARYNGKAALWWLRSPGRNNLHAAAVSFDGSVYGLGYSVFGPGGGVRPALWI
jgi:hypothetical protein